MDRERRIRDRCAFRVDAENSPGTFVVQSETCDDGGWSEYERVALTAARETGLTCQETISVTPEESLVPASGWCVCYDDADCVAEIEISFGGCAVALKSGERFRRWWSLWQEEIQKAVCR